MKTGVKDRFQTIESIKKILLVEKQLLIQNQAESRDIDLLDDILFQIDDLFMLVVAGEFNSGKSAFINALLGEKVLDMGITPTTAEITILRYGEKNELTRTDKGQSIIEMPNSLLEDISIVDTPGTNAILREHEELTTDFIPRSDLVLFITSVDRPFTESERKFLESIRDWGKKIVIIINKTDIVDDPADLEKVKIFVSSNAEKLLDIVPKIFTLSAKNVLIHKIENGSVLSEMAQVEDYIFKTLDLKNRLKLKLMNPLGILENFNSKYTKLNEAQQKLIQDDIQLLDAIDRQIELFREDMLRAFKFRYADIDNAILQFEKRGLEFFDSTFRIARVMDLLNKEKIKNDFNKLVIKDLSKDIDEKVNSAIDWLVEEDLKQWQVITQKINQRSSKYHDKILQDPGNQKFQLERQKIIAKINRESQRIIELFDKEAEASQIAEEAQMAVAASAAVEVGAIGLGTLVTLLATTASADLTGILLAGLTATLGFFIIPAKKRQTKNLFSKNIQKLRKKLEDTLFAEFSHQVDIVNENIRTTIQPYSRFIRSENSRLTETKKAFSDISSKCVQLKSKVEQL